MKKLLSNPLASAWLLAALTVVTVIAAQVIQKAAF